MRKIIVLIPLFFLISYNQLIIFNNLVYGVSDNMSETLITLPYEISGEDVEQIFNTPAGSYVYKVIATDEIQTIYTNDEQFLETFNKLSTNGKNIFMDKYYVYDKVPDSMMGKLYVKNGSDEYFSNLQILFDNQLEIEREYNQYSSRLYYIRYIYKLLLLNLVLFFFCLIYYLNLFEKNQRKLLIQELNGNQGMLKKQIVSLNVELLITYSLIFLLLVRVNTVIELISFLLVLGLMIINNLILSKIIYYVYKIKVRNSFRSSLYTQKTFYGYIFMAILVILTLLSINSFIGLSKNSLIYYNNYTIMKTKPEHFKTMYRAKDAWTSEIKSFSIPDLSGYPGYYFSYEKDFAELNINCKYAREYLNFQTCDLGTYTYSPGNDSETTYGTEMIVEPFDLLEPELINPTIKIIDNTQVITSDMYWDEDPNIPYLNIEQNGYFFNQEQNMNRSIILRYASKLLIQLMMLISTVSIFSNTYKTNYGRKLALKKLNGQRISLNHIYWFEAFFIFGLTSMILSKFSGVMGYYRFEWILSLIVMVLLLLVINRIIVRNIIKDIK